MYSSLYYSLGVCIRFLLQHRQLKLLRRRQQQQRQQVSVVTGVTLLARRSYQNC